MPDKRAAAESEGRGAVSGPAESGADTAPRPTSPAAPTQAPQTADEASTEPAPIGPDDERPTGGMPPAGSSDSSPPAPVAEPTLDPHFPTTADEQTAETAPTSSSSAIDDLEELILPSSIQPPTPLAPATTLGPDSRLRVREHLGARGQINRYSATWRDNDGTELPAELREAPVDDPALAREAEVLADVRYAMLPTCLATFEQDGKRYLALDLEQPIEAETLDEALRGGLNIEGAVSITLQLAQALRRLHQAGWAHVGLSPSDVRLSQPLRLTQLGSAVRIGQAPAQALHVPGYSAPELAHQAVVTGKEDVYTLGAILYRALTGQPLPETGPELAALPLVTQVPGAPQLLAPTLAPAEERIDLEDLYLRLLAFKQRLAQTSLALEVASATSVGLNPTRPVNEDSCAYLTWALAGADGLSYRALLCVADGMGGMEAGEIASQTAIRTILTAALDEGMWGGGEGETSSPRPPAPTLDPVEFIRLAAPAVHKAGQGREMGTTVTCAVVHDRDLTLGHVGDTRAYLLREGVLTQLTRDHSLVAAMVTSGVLTKEEARGHPDSNKVLRSLGGQRELPEQYVDGLEVAYGQPSLRLQPGDWLLFCSDGVWGSVPDEQLRTVLSEALNCSTAARVIVEHALRAGAPDNATALVARCVEAPAR